MGRSSRIVCGGMVVFSLGLGLSAHAQEGSGLVIRNSSWGLSGPTKIWNDPTLRSADLPSPTRLAREFSLTSLSPSIPEGLRMTGGVTWGNNTVLSSSDTLVNTPTRIDQRLLNPNMLANVENRPTAFLGVGYLSTTSPDSNWRLQADLGVTMNLPAGAKFGSNLGAVEDTLRDLRIGPLMRIRLLYSF